MLDETPDRLGPLAEPMAAAVADLRAADAVARLWAADHTLWRPDPTEIRDRLGWLTVIPEMLADLDALRAQCEALLDGIDHVLVMGMGGSSLFPEVLAGAYGGLDGRVEGHPRLHVVDTTDPATLARLDAELPPERTLHVAASKSGTTLETACQLDWAWGRQASPDPRRFAVITDPGSTLAALAAERGFGATWLNRPDIGGRYSALSLFGLVPGLLAGADVEGMLASASAMAERLRGAAGVNAGAKLAAVLAAGVRTGRDKVTVLLPDEIAGFGLWLEQLLAESTGKDGTGLIPVVGEPPADPEAYGDDRIFIALVDGSDLEDADESSRARLARFDALAAAGHPVWLLPFHGLADLGAQVLLWEVATALCGALLDIHPFDQPDVAAAKEATNLVLAGGDKPGALTGDRAALEALLADVRPGDYVAIQAFVDPGSEAAADIEQIRLRLRDRLGVAVTTGLGPRYLHSTGQLHKGGPDSGVFIQVAPGTENGVAVPIPGRPYTFGDVISAQATGDLLALQQRGRRVVRVSADVLLEDL